MSSQVRIFWRFVGICQYFSHISLRIHTFRASVKIRGGMGETSEAKRKIDHDDLGGSFGFPV